MDSALILRPRVPPALRQGPFSPSLATGTLGHPWPADVELAGYPSRLALVWHDDRMAEQVSRDHPHDDRMAKDVCLATLSLVQ